MEPGTIMLAVAVGVGLVLAAALLFRVRGRRRRHKTTRAGLRKRALEESGALIALIREREASRPAVEDEFYEKAHEQATQHDEELRQIYRSDHLPRIEDLREQFAERGIRDEALDEAYGAARNEAEVRTVSTALLVMADRLG